MPLSFDKRNPFSALFGIIKRGGDFSRNTTMANPAFNEETYDKFEERGYGGGYAQGQMSRPDQAQAEVMTVNGTLNKTLILFALLVASSAFIWSLFFAGNALALPLMLGGFVGAFIVGIVTAFKPQAAKITAPIYAVLEGLFVGGISAILSMQYPGIVGQAVAATFAVAGLMFGIYRSGLIKVTEKLKFGVIAATGAIGLVYMVSNVMLLVFHNPGLANFFWGNSLLSLGISIVITGVAAFNLLLDFDVIEKGVERRAPKFMEWYAGYGLMVTLVWLYLELLRLLAKLRR